MKACGAVRRIEVKLEGRERCPVGSTPAYCKFGWTRSSGFRSPCSSHDSPPTSPKSSATDNLRGPATRESQRRSTSPLIDVCFDRMQVAVLSRALVIPKKSLDSVYEALNHLPPLKKALLRITNTNPRQRNGPHPSELSSIDVSYLRT